MQSSRKMFAILNYSGRLYSVTLCFVKTSAIELFQEIDVPENKMKSLNNPCK